MSYKRKAARLPQGVDLFSHLHFTFFNLPLNTLLTWVILILHTDLKENSVVMSMIAQSSGVSFSNLCLLCFVLETYHFKLLY